MKSTIINTYDIAGGAALGAYGIAQALNRYTDIETRILCKTKFSSDKHIDAILKGKRKWVAGIFNDYFVKYAIGQSYWYPSKSRILRHRFIKDADIINIHNLHGDYIAYPVMKDLSKIAPILVSMHDMWYLTGHCAFTYDCNQLTSGCRSCPDLGSYPDLKFDTASFHWKKKRSLYANPNVSFVASSKWLMNQAKKNPLFQDKKIACIYNPFDIEKLKPRDKTLVRKALELPLNKNIITFGAAAISAARKGFPDFIEVITKKYVERNNLFLLLMGRDPQNIVNEIPSWLPYRYFGNIPSEEFRSLIFNASDVFIFPTLAENLSNMLIESLSSGTPCVAFNVGGCGEVVQTNNTGYLAKANDFNDFLYGIEILVNEGDLNEKLSKNAREIIINNFTYEICARNYEKLIKGIVGEAALTSKGGNFEK